MKAEEIRDLEDQQIERRIGELKEELFRLRFRSATAPLDNPNIFKQVRRTIARMKTILRERELEREASTSGPEAEAEAEGAETAAAS